MSLSSCSPVRRCLFSSSPPTTRGATVEGHIVFHEVLVQDSNIKTNGAFVLRRCFAILRPMANVVNVARRGKMMLTVAWSLATVCSIPQVRASFACPATCCYVSSILRELHPIRFNKLVQTIW
jgi:hypothetical protein